MSERACLPSEPGRVALLPDGRHVVRSRPFHRERARADLVAGVADNRCRLAGEYRLVEREPVAAAQDSVGDDLVAGLEEHDVVLDHLFDCDPTRLAVAINPSRRGVG